MPSFSLQRRTPRMFFGKVEVALPPGAFLQPSALGEAALVRAVTTLLKGRKRIADLYAGCGTFTFALAAGAKLHAVEGDAAAHEALAAAARGLGGRVVTERRDLAAVPLTAAELDRFDAVLLDPPRAGARTQAAAIAASRLDLAVYVSCDPRSFARDARLLIDGGFRLERLLPDRPVSLVGASGAGGRVSAVERLRSVDGSIAIQPHCARWRSRWSASTIAIMASPTGTARMPTQGSWRPLVEISVSSPAVLTVWRGVRIELVGLTAKRTTMSWPEEMPPKMPPALLEAKVTPSLPMRISSALASPVSAAAAKPAPISTPFTALMLIMALARSASSLP